MIKTIYNGKKNIKFINSEIPKAGDNDIVIKKHLFKYLRN